MPWRLFAATGKGIATRWDTDWPIAVSWVGGIVVGMIVIVSLTQWLRRGSAWQPSTNRAIVLWGLRALAIVIVGWMIGRWHQDRYETVLPDIVLMLDTSESMQLSASDEESRIFEARSDRPLTRWEALRRWLTRDDLVALRRLAEKYRLRVSFVAGDQNRFLGDLKELGKSLEEREALGQQSRIGDHLLAAARGQRGSSTAAMILWTDGQVTDGASLAEAAEEVAALRLPVFAFPVGRRDPQPKVALTEVLAEPTAMVGDMVEILVRWSWRGKSEGPLEIRLIDVLDDRIVDRVSVSRGEVEDAAELQATGTEVLRFLATAPGLRRLRVEIDNVPGEENVSDNTREMMVEVRDDRFRVLLVQGGPSYEFRFLKHLLERATTRNGEQPLIDLTTVLQRGDAGYADQDRSAVRLPPVDDTVLEQLDLVILSDCSPAGLGTLFLEKIADLVTRVGVSLVILSGPEHLPAALAGTPLDLLMPVDPHKLLVQPSALGYRWRITPLGQTVPALRIGGEAASPVDEDFPWWNSAPVVYGLAPGARVRPAGRVLATLEGMAGDPPSTAAIVSQFVGNGQVWVHLTDETFRFRTADREAAGYERFWLQLVRGLAQRRAILGDDEAMLEVDGDAFGLGERVAYQVRLGASLAVEASSGAKVTLFGPGEEASLLTAKPDPGIRGSFRGTIDGLKVGNYRMVLTQPLGAAAPPSDLFRIVQQDRERKLSEVDLEGLSRLTAITGGRLFDLEMTIDEVVAALPVGEAIEVKTMEPRLVWNHPLIALGLFGLLVSEWVLRRVWGGA